MFPDREILVGVALFNVPVPPEIDKTKSDTSKLPEPSSLLNTSSLKVTPNGVFEMGISASAL